MTEKPGHRFLFKEFATFPPAGFRGTVVRPTDASYHQLRQIANARTGGHPALIAQCRDVDDVVMAVEYCRDQREPIAIRSGGHAIDGHAMPHDAFVIDMSLMKHVQIDPATGITEIEAGVLLGEMDAATQKHGFVVPAGTVSVTGAAGLTLGGGVGYLTRRFGMTVDNLLSVNVVTVEGQQLRASEEEHPELFWGLCGAGHNLAVATSFTYRARKVGPEVMSGLVIYDIKDAVAVLSQMDEVMAAAPRELTIYPVVLPAPSLPGLPSAMTGVPILALIVVYTGCLSTYQEAIAGVRLLESRPLADMVHPSTWLAANSILDVLAPAGRRQHSRGGYIAAMTREMAQMVVDQVMAAPAPDDAAGPSVAVAFPCLGGASHDLDEDSKAFSRKGAKWLWEVLGQWDVKDKDDEYMGWVDGVMNALEPFSLGNGYVNLSADRGAEWLSHLYGSREKWERICALKGTFDPNNRLCYNKNIVVEQS